MCPFKAHIQNPISFLMCPEYNRAAVCSGLLRFLHVLLSIPKPPDPDHSFHPGHLAGLFLQLGILKSEKMLQKNAPHSPA